MVPLALYPSPKLFLLKISTIIAGFYNCDYVCTHYLLKSFSFLKSPAEFLTSAIHWTGLSFRNGLLNSGFSCLLLNFQVWKDVPQYQWIHVSKHRKSSLQNFPLPRSLRVQTMRSFKNIFYYYYFFFPQKDYFC